LLAVGAGDDQVGSLQGHVAVDAGGDDFFVKLWERAALLRLVTFHTIGGKRGGVVLELVHVVASGAGHLRRRLIAAAHLQQADLVAVNVGGRGCVTRKRSGVFVERLARQVRKDWQQRDAAATVALRANFDLAITRQVRRIHDARR